MRDRDDDRRGHGRHNRSGEWLGSNTQPTQNPAYLGGKRDRQRGDVQSRRRGIEDSVSAVTGSQDNEHTAEIGRLAGSIYPTANRPGKPIRPKTTYLRNHPCKARRRLVPSRRGAALPKVEQSAPINIGGRKSGHAGVCPLTCG